MWIDNYLNFLYCTRVIFFFCFFSESFNLFCPLLMSILYHQTKISISFWCRRGLNPKSLIQPSETLLVELVETHLYTGNLNPSINHHARNIPSILTICYKGIFIVYFILFCVCVKKYNSPNMIQHSHPKLLSYCILPS